MIANPKRYTSSALNSEQISILGLKWLVITTLLAERDFHGDTRWYKNETLPKIDPHYSMRSHDGLLERLIIELQRKK